MFKFLNWFKTAFVENEPYVEIPHKDIFEVRKLSDLILEGSKIYPQSIGQLYVFGDRLKIQAACAMGVAKLVFYNFDSLLTINSSLLYSEDGKELDAFWEIYSPVTLQYWNTYNITIIQDNDRGTSREEIAFKLKAIGC